MLQDTCVTICASLRNATYVMSISSMEWRFVHRADNTDVHNVNCYVHGVCACDMVILWYTEYTTIVLHISSMHNVYVLIGPCMLCTLPFVHGGHGLTLLTLLIHVYSSITCPWMSTVYVNDCTSLDCPHIHECSAHLRRISTLEHCVAVCHTATLVVIVTCNFITFSLLSSM